MGTARGVLARSRARRHAVGADSGRAGHRKVPPGRGIVRVVLAPGRRRGACQMLFRLWPPRLRSHCRMAPVGAFERRVFAIGPGAARRTRTRPAGDSDGEPGHPTAAAPHRELGTAALLCRPERGLCQGPRPAPPADRRPAVVRSGLLRMAAFAVPRRHGLTNSGGGHGAARRDRPDSPARQSVERSAPVRAGRGASALAAHCRRDRGIGRPGGQPPARCRRFGRSLPCDQGQSAVRGGECARRGFIRRHRYAAADPRRHHRAPRAALRPGL